MDPRIEQILEQKRHEAEAQDWSTAKEMLAGISMAREAIERALARDRSATPRALAAVVEACRPQLAELWTDASGFQRDFR